MKNNTPITLYAGALLALFFSFTFSSQRKISPTLPQKPSSNWINVIPGDDVYVHQVGARLIYSNPNLYPNLALPQGLFFWKTDQTIRPIAIKNKKITKGDQYIYDPKSQVYRHRRSNAPYKPGTMQDPSPRAAALRKSKEALIRQQNVIKAGLRGVTPPKQPQRPAAGRIVPTPQPRKVPQRPAVRAPVRGKSNKKGVTPTRIPAKSPQKPRAHGVPVRSLAQRRLPTAPPQPARIPASSSGAQTYSSIAKQALEYTNQFRRSRGLPPVAWHQAIAEQAYVHSANMGNKKVPFSHEGFNIRANQLRARSASENIFMGNMRGDIAKIAVDGWIKSPGHLKNIVGNYTHCGIGIYQNRDGYWYLTQIFASF